MIVPCLCWGPGNIGGGHCHTVLFAEDVCARLWLLGSRTSATNADGKPLHCNQYSVKMIVYIYCYIHVPHSVEQFIAVVKLNAIRV